MQPRVARLFGDICGKGVVLSFGFCPPVPGTSAMYLFGITKGHKGSTANSKIRKCGPCVPIVLCS